MMPQVHYAGSQPLPQAGVIETPKGDWAPVNASRSIKLKSGLAGPDGTPVHIKGETLVPVKTQSPAVNNLNEKAFTVKNFSVKSALDFAKSTASGGAYGSACGLLLGVATMFSVSLQRKKSWAAVAAPLATTALGGILGAGLRAYQALTKTVTEGVDILAEK